MLISEITNIPSEAIAITTILPLHSIGTPPYCLHALGREMAKDRLIGTSNGTPPVTMRQRQSWPLLIRSFKELQHAEVGDEALEPVARKPRHEPKLRIMGPVHTAFVFVFEFDCAITSRERERMVMMMRMVEKGSSGFMLRERGRERVCVLS